MCSVGAKMITVTTVATGIISKPLRANLSNIRENTKLRNYEKQPYWALHTHARTRTHTSGSAHVKVQNIFSVRNNITCSTDCNYSTAATL